MNSPHETSFGKPSSDKILLTFDEARRFHQWSFAQTTIEQRIQWLADMLEISQIALAARQNCESS